MVTGPSAARPQGAQEEPPPPEVVPAVLGEGGGGTAHLQACVGGVPGSGWDQE